MGVGYLQDSFSPTCNKLNSISIGNRQAIKIVQPHSLYPLKGRCNPQSGVFDRRDIQKLRITS